MTPVVRRTILASAEMRREILKSEPRVNPLDFYVGTQYWLKPHLTTHITLNQALATLATLLNRVTINREIVIIQRDGEEDVAMITASELSSLLETAYLLSSPANAKRLLGALQRATEPQSPA